MPSVMFASVENSVYRLANAIRKTQRRANALENIVIPRYQETANGPDVPEKAQHPDFPPMKPSCRPPFTLIVGRNFRN